MTEEMIETLEYEEEHSEDSGYYQSNDTDDEQYYEPLVD